MQGRRRPSDPTLPAVLCGFLAVASLALLLTVPSHAQPQFAAEGVPQIVLDGIARAGLHTATNLRQRGPNFTANALTRTGAPVKIVIQGNTGAIIGYRVITPVEVRP